MASQVSPPTPDWLTQINFIKYYAMNSCDRPISLYFETALPVAGEIAIELLSWDWYSFVKRIIRPKMLRSQRHGRTGRRGARGPGGIPEVTDIVAHHVDRERKYRLPDTFGRTAFLFVIDDVWERAQNTAFIIEKSIELPYRTILGVIAIDPSKCPKQGNILRVGAGEGIAAIGPEWKSFLIPTLEYFANTSPGTPIAWATLGGSWSVMLELEARANTAGTRKLRTRLVDTAHGVEIARSSDVDLNHESYTTVTCAGTVDPGGNVVWEASLSASTALIRDIKMFGIRTG